MEAVQTVTMRNLWVKVEIMAPVQTEVVVDALLQGAVGMRVQGLRPHEQQEQHWQRRQEREWERGRRLGRR